MHKIIKVAVLGACIVVLTLTVALAFGNGNIESIIGHGSIKQEESEGNPLSGNKDTLQVDDERANEENLLIESLYSLPLYSTNASENLPKTVGRKELLNKIEGLSKEKKEELLALEKKGQSHFGIFARRTAQIFGEIPENQERVKLSEVRDVISNNDFESSLRDIEKIHGAPDYVGGSGVTIVEFWLDDKGKERISAIIEQGEIYYNQMLDEFTMKQSEKLNKQ
ncbi:hypothetical protein PAECIP111893_00915 [Paenibacillus plantiphilus]|uniref:Uncharacterized protein n=1 Tax=Paenibacillus plantiphilus TaxID=2905650 RepID=A0ABN8G3A3_9BACL|nr:hypothetical protein [Paenibacillus plantiphilus]CAH1197725.1 hypothetical protein PAECIP111893_00915 [Paenibacillus plantiphilus]